MISALIRELITRGSQTISDHAEELTKLDQAIGDGDHGINMKRGFEFLVADADKIAELPMDAALQKAGMTLVMKIGGASGPLYGSLLMGMAKAAKADKSFIEQLGEGIAAVKKRGKSDVGAKTMLDVLVPVHAALEASPDISVDTVKAEAAKAREATKDMIATKGRASFLGERSMGHYDPGATSSWLLIETVCDVLKEQN